MTPAQFRREFALGRMTPDRAVWIMEQYPEVRDWWTQVCRAASEACRTFDRIIVDAGRELADEAERIANR